jgi:cytochrome P450
VARIGPTYVLVSSPIEIRRIWSIRSGYYRAPWYEGFRFDPNRDSLVTTIQPAEHSRIRGLVIRGYSGKGLMPNQEQVMDEHIEKFLSLIERRYVSSRTKLRPWEMARGMQYLTWDVASAVEFGEPFGFLDADADMYDAIAALETMVLPCGIMALLPELLALVKSPLIKPLLPKPTDSHGVGRLLGVIAERIEARYSQKVHRDDVLQVFMRSGLSRDDVESEALLHLFAGSDTTAMAARTTVFYIATCPAAYKRLQAEIDGVAATVTRPVISDGEAKGLRFLQACIKESLRMWPPAAAIAAKISDVDDVISGVKVPAGTSVAVSWLEMMRDKNVFGEDAEIWSPARWLDSDPETLKEMEATQGMAFANGSRWECLGKRLASMELGKVLFEVSNPCLPW